MFARSLLIALAVAFGFVHAPAAQATIITVVVNTTVTDNPLAIAGPAAGFFTPGEAVRITYSFDDTVADSDPVVGDGVFFDSLTQLDVEFLDSGMSFLFGGTAGTFVTTDDNVNGTQDSMAISSLLRVGGDASLGGEVPFALAVGLNADGSPLVVNDNLGAGPFSITGGSITIRTGSTGQFGTSMLLNGNTVPEPGSAALVSLGLMGIAAARSRRD